MHNPLGRFLNSVKMFSNPQLGAYRVAAGPPEHLDLEILLNPLEEQFLRPSHHVSFSFFLGGKGKNVSAEEKVPIYFSIVEGHLLQGTRVVFFRFF